MRFYLLCRVYIRAKAHPATVFANSHTGTNVHTCTQTVSVSSLHWMLTVEQCQVALAVSDPFNTNVTCVSSIKTHTG